MDENEPLRKALWAVVCTAIIVAAVILVLEFRFEMANQIGLESKSLRLELLKVLWQFLLIAVLGGAIGLFFKGQEKKAEEQTNREHREEELRATRRERLLSTRGQLIESYHQAKAIRRLLRALACGSSNGNETLVKAEYIPLMRQLIDVQLKIEYYADFIEADTTIFRDAKSIAGHLKTAEKYLNDVVDEFEGAWKEFADQEFAPLSRFGCLLEFIQPFSKEAPFNQRLKEPFDTALKAIESEAKSPWRKDTQPNQAPAADGKGRR